MQHTQIWRVTISNNTSHYFEAKVEADFFVKDMLKNGTTCRTHPVPLPRNAKEFTAFMERIEENQHHAEALLKEIEEITPNWRAFRNLAEAVEVNISLSKP